MKPYYVSIKKSTNKTKKLMAIFYDKDMNKIKTVHYGASGYSDYTLHLDPKRKERYIARHSKNNQDWTDPMTAGTLSRYVLWNKTTIEASIKDYIKRFRLKLLK